MDLVCFIGQMVVYADAIKKGAVISMIYLWILLFPVALLWKLSEHV